MGENFVFKASSADKLCGFGMTKKKTDRKVDRKTYDLFT
jgi:hypothetical protein